MGGSSWSDDFYKNRTSSRIKEGKSAFEYSDTIKSTTPRSSWIVHEKLDPKNITRESRDSEDHPNSNAIAVLFDVTGSMGSIPITLQKKLPNLLNMLIRKGYIEDPQILFGAVGDVTCDRIPLQIGQFESGNEMENDLELIMIERGGGAGSRESYELGLYFFANNIIMDCLDKRGNKGYLFTIGDEMPYRMIKKSEVENVLGSTIQADLPIEEVIEKLQTKFNYFHILPSKAHHGHNNVIRDEWVELLGQNVIHLDNPDAVCESIALCIGINEDVIDIDAGIDDLDDFDTSDVIKTSVSTALSTLSGTGGIVKNAQDLPNTSGGSSERL